MSLKALSLVLELERTCDRAEAFTWMQRNVNEPVKYNTELRSGNCIEDGCDPFILPRYRVSSAIGRVSEGVQTDEETPNLWVRTIWANAGTSA